MIRTVFTILFLLLACVEGFGQSTFQGLTPGKSTRAEVERVLGQPVKPASATLFEYKPRWNADRIYAQYDDAGPAATLERIELTCTEPPGFVSAGPDSGCSRLHFAMQENYSVNVYMADAVKKLIRADGDTRYSYYFAQPRFMVFTEPFANDAGGKELRWAFYSAALFAGAAPKNLTCGGLRLLGTWDTNRGRMTIVREGATVGRGLLASERVTGTYSEGTGSFRGLLNQFTLEAEWKDDTGTGTMRLRAGGQTMSGEWKRTSGNGPGEGTWEGRCVETN